MNQRSQSSDDDDESSDSSPEAGVTEKVIKRAYDQVFQPQDHLLFGLRDNAIDLVTLHPCQIMIIRLWQIYLDNVNPLLKVTHTPTLQIQIIEAASNLATVQPNLAALMFAIYCVAILSVDDEKCHSLFGSSRKLLLNRYQFACQQALWECHFLRTNERDVLTAFYLYLVSPEECFASSAPF